MQQRQRLRACERVPAAGADAAAGVRNVLPPHALCNTGTCPLQTTVNCKGACVSTPPAHCPGSCTADTDCLAGNFCNNTGNCVPQVTQGNACNLTLDCL